MRGREKRFRGKRWASLRSATTYTIGRLVLSLRNPTYKIEDMCRDKLNPQSFLI